MSHIAELPPPPIEPEIKSDNSLAQKNSYWESYYGASQDRPPAQILVEAINHVEHKESACDLGAGTLRDARFLLDRGFKHVTTVDSSGPYKKIMSENKDERIVMKNDDLELFELPPSSFDLVSGQRVFHYTEGSSLAGGFIANIASILRQGGIFTTTLFSDKDILNIKKSNDERPSGFFPSEDQLKTLLEKYFEIIKLEEKQKDGETVAGRPLVNHVLEVIARKR